jgi:hypothetical protein
MSAASIGTVDYGGDFVEFTSETVQLVLDWVVYLYGWDAPVGTHYTAPYA